MATNKVAANVLMIVLIVGGLVTLVASVTKEVFTEVELDIVAASVVYPGGHTTTRDQHRGPAGGASQTRLDDRGHRQTHPTCVGRNTCGRREDRSRRGKSIVETKALSASHP